jgi:hypothetical protein
MTLLVAGVGTKTLWMVADTFITGGALDVRSYEHQIKIVPSLDGKALIGFAGDQQSGSTAIELARTIASGAAAVDYLRDIADQYPVDFAYGWLDGTEPHLFRISRREAVELTVLNIGEASAFSQFQAIRHRSEIDPVPKSISTFMLGGRSKEKPPEGLGQSVAAMLRLFFERPERDVGGAAIPYLLTPDGVFLCGYGYSITDPITDTLTEGSVIPHGTAGGGGFGLSVTEYNGDQGVVVYWLQKPGGLIFLRTNSGFDVLEFEGEPLAFLEQAQNKLGRPVEIWFGGPSPTGRPDRIGILRDLTGKPTMVVARFGRELQFNAIDTSADFRTRPATMDLNDDDELSCMVATVTLAENATAASVQLLADGATICNPTYNAVQLDALIATLSAARMRLDAPVSAEPNEGRTQEMVVIDPAWRTDHPPHPSLDGLLLRLRHSGLGWLTFLLPHNEAIALGDWLSKNARR